MNSHLNTILTAFGLLVAAVAGRQNCRCETDSLMQEAISCDTVTFSNGSILFWNFNCDSSWLTFKSPNQKELVIFSLSEGLQDMTGRLGYNYIREFKKTFLIQNNVISGCCVPPEFFLYDKTTGKKAKSLGRLLFFSDDNSLPFVIGLTGSGYNQASKSKISNNSLTVYNIDKAKTYFIPLPKGQIDKACRLFSELHPEYLFEPPTVNGSIVTLMYRYTNSNDKHGMPLLKAIKIDLRKYVK